MKTKNATLPLLLHILIVSLLPVLAVAAQSWQYIQVDDARQKWGDWDEPEWLRYFGLDAGDLNKDGYLDMVSGRYAYLNPGGDMAGVWRRVDFGANTDGALILDIDGDDNADVVATSLPTLYWLEADDIKAESWVLRPVARVKETGHVNGQGFAVADIVTGDKSEILISGGDGLYMI